jgi:hypothetical protein
MLRRGLAGIVVVALSVLAGVNFAAGAPILVDSLTRDYATSGTNVWGLAEQIYQDSAQNTTRFYLTLRNDSAPFPITSLHLADNGIQGLAALLPTNWTFTAGPTEWVWQTTAGNGTVGTTPLALGYVQVTGLVPDALGQVGIDIIINGVTNAHTQADWQALAPAVTNPEPGTLLLIGTGLTLAAWRARKAPKGRTE